jgi:hypothetical protein
MFNNKVRIFESFFDIKYFLLALCPILSLYSFIPLFSIGYFCLIVYMIIDLLFRRRSQRFNFTIIVIMLLLILINIFSGFINDYILDITQSFNNTAGMIVFSIIAAFYCVSSNLNKEKWYKASKIVAIAATLYLFYQYFSYYFLNTIHSGLVPFLKLAGDNVYESIIYGRPNSFFYEPAHYAIYILPVLAISISKREYLIGILLIVGLFLSTSTTGIAITIFIILFTFIKSKSTQIIPTLLFVLLVMIFIFFIVPDKILNVFLFDKLSQQSLFESLRIFKPLDYFQFLSGSNWLFGVGLNQLSSYIGTMIIGDVENYANVYFFSIFSFGIIGGVIWISYMISLYKNVLSEFKVIFYLFIIICFTDQLLFNRNLLYLLIFVYAYSRPSFEKKKNSNIII